MWVKICGNTNLEDALFAAEAGADAVGFIFTKSPREIRPEEARRIVNGLPPELEKIGVFYSLASEEIENVVRAAGLTGVQLHGGYSHDLPVALRETLGDELRIIQTHHWNVTGQSSAAFAEGLRSYREVPEIEAVLVDSRTATAGGGTGVIFDWLKAKETLSELGEKPLIVAGGLNPRNVAEAIRMLQPWGVDVSSGVELTPGKKNHDEVRAFIQNARAAVVESVQA